MKFRELLENKYINLSTSDALLKLINGKKLIKLVKILLLLNKQNQ